MRLNASFKKEFWVMEAAYLDCVSRCWLLRAMFRHGAKINLSTFYADVTTSIKKSTLNKK